jgi:lipoteichoic acid synthase
VPFFATLWAYQTHYPYFVSGAEKQYTDEPELNRFLNALNNCDNVLGEIINGLRNLKVLDETLIVILGDHGEAFGRHGQLAHASMIYEENLHIPLMFYNEKLFKGERLTEIANMADIAPTICSILNINPPEQWQGDVLFTNNKEKAAYFFAPWADQWFGVREGAYKLLFNATLNEFELYNIEKDPFEEKNLYNANDEIAKSLKGKLSGWVKYQNDFMKKYMKKSV